jgi:hypothetical protein
MDNARVHTARATQEKLDVFRFKRHSHPIPRILHHPALLFGWLKTQLERRGYNEEDELSEVGDEILTGLSIEMIEPVFFDWMNRLQRLIDGNGGHVS